MANIIACKFAPLDNEGENYMCWKKDMSLLLEKKSLHETIEENNVTTRAQKADTMIHIRQHISEAMKQEFSCEDDPYLVWKTISERFDHQRDYLLPIARDEWAALRFQDFKKVTEYNCALFRIVSHLRFCEVKVSESEMLDKTLTTFHASNVTLQQQYRLRGYEKYSELITALLVAEKNNELLIKNHQSRPTGSKAFPEANAVNSNEPSKTNHFYGQERARGQGRGRGRGGRHSRGRGRGRGGYFNNTPRSTSYYHKKQHGGYESRENPRKNDRDGHENSENICYRCGSKGHWSRVCRVPEHLCKLYKASLKGKGKEVNFIVQDPLDDSTHLDASDFIDGFDDQAIGGN